MNENWEKEKNNLRQIVFLRADFDYNSQFKLVRRQPWIWQWVGLFKNWCGLAIIISSKIFLLSVNTIFLQIW